MKHSVSYWPFEAIPLEEFAEKILPLGYTGIDLLHPEQARRVRPLGIECPVSAAPEHESGLGCIERAFNRKEHHPTLHQIYEKLIPEAAEAGISQVICFSGNREGLDDVTGMENCAAGIAPLLPLAERNGVTLIMELLNSDVDHPDYQCDHSDWAAGLASLLDSPNFGVLYDIYHMQIMEGDIIQTIRRHHRHFTHYHTAGNPGRNEIGPNQELNYPAICRAIRETGFEGYLAQEFVPLGNPLAALQEAIDLCS
ncbi:MAG: TIM barrel protein [Verrucomicrobiota bacterium JB023]|nr:TIM barrel protein [Verrucomicrobiota bacterium JB023]